MSDLILYHKRHSLLSPNVFKMLNHAFLQDAVHVRQTRCIENNMKLINEDLSINWESLKILVELEDEEYSVIVQKLQPFFCEAEVKFQKFLESPSPPDLSSLTWTGQISVLSSILEYSKAIGCEGYKLLALLLLTALTEQAIGNVLLLKQKNVPSLLSSMVVEENLAVILGEYRVRLLQVLVGAVKGVNLRNISWHGFIFPHEVSLRSIASLFTVIYDIGMFLQENSIKVDCRELKVISTPTSNLLGVQCGAELNGLILESPLVHPRMHAAWICALNLVSQRNGDAIVLLLPLLECALRYLYCTVNKLDTRVLSAEDDMFYVTFDEMLSENISITPGTLSGSVQPAVRNGVPLILGKQLMEVLYDLFYFGAGPKVRNRVSHGELQQDGFPYCLVQHVLALCVLVLNVGYWQLDSYYQVCNLLLTESQFSQEEKCNLMELVGGIFSEKKQSPGLQKLVETMIMCRSVFHPIPQLSRDIIGVCVSLSQYRTWPHPSCVSFQFTDCDNEVKNVCPLNINEHMQFYTLEYLGISHKISGMNEVSDLTYILSSKDYLVLFRPRLELELTVIMGKIALNISSSVDNVQMNLSESYVLFTEKKLRSRQRSTYQRLLSCIPQFMLSLVLLVNFLAFILVNIVEICHYSKCDEIMKDMKKLLKCTDNIRVDTSKHVNKWDEVMKYCRRSTELLKNYASLDKIGSECTQ